MKILAIDTSAKAASVALCEDSRLLSLYTQNIGLTHSETILPMIESALKCAHIDIDEIDMFACSIGPGSFTGVRIGVSAIKGLAYGKNKICIGVSALEALARNINAENATVVPVMDARRGTVYNAVFKIEKGKLTRITDDRLSDASFLANELCNTDGDIYFVGDGYDIMDKIFKGRNSSTSEFLRCQNGYSVAMSAIDKYKNSTEKEKADFCDKLLCPEYLRPSQAERMYENKE